MLTGVHVAFLGGDARQLEVIKKCVEMDATVTLIGFDNLESTFQGVHLKELEPKILEDVDCLILPIVGTDEDGYVESIFSKKKLKLTEEFLSHLPKTSKIYTGMARQYLKNLTNDLQIDLVELLDRDDVAIYNSIPTAEGTIMMTIQNTNFTIHGSNAIVLGFGRTGITLARVLGALGAKVKVGARRPEHLARIYEMGLQPFYISELAEQVKDVDLLYNTIPHIIVTAKVIANMPHHALIIDLASKPGGTDFRYAEKRGIKALLAPGLPGIVAPKTAGIIISNVLTKLILEQFGDQGGN
ncbi:dipicolinic acid synthetase subunit A [Vulcanibacillus modesticaldus]|uniref:Dipicolinic acid synthetase subunit A n=1 Tax=Vulcanibacillus modesticaldus TaxID=337097 RepID=A0A1D2YXL1_9BACI|nr:dipicolinate synthase subunit DpsA [Vulcanibacillus modesticaldus]OEG00454.1 dipicolinic acid synthetase subunit A [Vulcanibacillus modesticaldus]